MPLPIAHGLVGASAVALVYRDGREKNNWKPLIVGAVLAIMPDLDFPFEWYLGWHEFHRGPSHSLVVAALTGAVLAVVLGPKRLREAAAYTLALMSHSLLDFATTGVGGGVALFWPALESRFKWGAFALSEFEDGIGSLAVLLQHADLLLRSALVEAALFAPLLLISLWLTRRTTVRSAGSNDPLAARRARVEKLDDARNPGKKGRETTEDSSVAAHI